MPMPGRTEGNPGKHAIEIRLHPRPGSLFKRSFLVRLAGVGFLLIAAAGNPAACRSRPGWRKARAVRQMAEATGHTTGSIFWRLKRIYRKQSISRQADLVRLVLSIAELGYPQRCPRSR